MNNSGYLRAKIEVMSPDLKIREMYHRFFIRKSAEDLEDKRTDFKHLGEGLVLVTQENYIVLRFLVLDLEKKLSEVNFEHVFSIKKHQYPGFSLWDKQFTGIAIDSGVTYFYDLDGYLESLVESKRRLKLQNSDRRRKSKRKADEIRDNPGAGEQMRSGCKKIKFS